MGVPFGTKDHISSISAFVTAIHPLSNPLRYAALPHLHNSSVSHVSCIAARGNSMALSAVNIIPIRVGNVDGAVKPAARIPSVQNIFTLRCLIVPLSNLGTDRVSSNGNPVFPQYLTIFHQQQEPLFFDNNNLISMNDAGWGLTWQTAEENKQNTENLLHNFSSLFNRFLQQQPFLRPSKV